MTLSDISIKRPVFAWMLMLCLVAFGLISFGRLGVSQLPDVDFPVISVSASLPGAAPEVMETEVADTLEDAMMSIPGVKEVSSTSRQGSTTVTIEFELSKDIDVALQEVQTKVTQAQRNLPKDLDPPTISKTNPEDQPIMWVALSGNKPLRELMDYARDHVKDAMTSSPGVGEVTLGGYIDPNVRIWVDGDKLFKYQLTVGDILGSINSQHLEVPAGYIDNPKTEMTVRMMGEVTSISGFENMLITSRGGSPLWTNFKLSDVATIEDNLNDIRRISRYSQQPSVGLGIRKQRGVNAVGVAKGIKARVEDIKKTLPEGMSLNIVFDTTQFIEDSTHELQSTLILSAVLTSIVCWLFMGSISSAINIVMAIPVSILGTFIFMYFFGFTLNTFTLLALSLVIGIVVDDAIMVLENIVRHAEMGKAKVKAALEGAREITFAAVAASVAILAIFVPVIFMKGIIGKFFYQFGITISIAVMISLLEALTLAPMRSSQFLQVHHSSRFGKMMDRFMHGLSRGYATSLTLCLRFRWTVIFMAIGVFMSSFWIAKSLQKEFVPSQDQGRFMVRAQTKLGSSLAFTNETFKQAEAAIMKVPAVKGYYAAIGGFSGGEVNAGMMFVTMQEYKTRPINPKTGKRYTQKDVMDLTRAEFKKISQFQRVVLQDLSLSGFSAQRGFPVEFTLRGGNWETLSQISQKIQERMEASGVMTDIDSDYKLGMPEVQIVPDRAKAAAHGVSIETIGKNIEALVGGVRAGKYTKNGKRYDVRVRLKPEQRQLPEQINHIWVQNNRGELIRLSEVVTVTQRQTLLTITRKNRERAIGIFANIAPGKAQGDAIAEIKKIAKDVVPEGYRVVLSGSAETYKETSQSLIFALVMGIFVAYMVLASQFNSFIHPVTVLLSLPFSITGALLALRLTHQSLNIYSMIGILLLMGIVKKNAILLVDFANERRRDGLPVKEALLEACPIRLRPILMTSIATVAAAIPPAMSLGAGSETHRPMAVVIIGGVVLSTFLTLYVVPCAYSLFSNLENKKSREELRLALQEMGELR
jgi:hydrophobe/amphiphile efflux-1 (HAE1) family protein